MAKRRKLLTKADRSKDTGELSNATLPRGGRETALSPVTVGAVVDQLGGRPGRGQIMLTTDGQAFEWFGPGQPLYPVAPAGVAGRQFDYPVQVNVNQTPRAGEISFGTLRALADSYDLLRLVIETRKDQVESFEWAIVAKKDKKVSDEELAAANLFFKKPDKEHMWAGWLRMILEDLFVLDAISVYPRKTRGGDLWALELIDSGTIKRVLDQGGRTPMPPDPAYQQVLKGLPAINYTAEELIYLMRNPRTNRIYGFSPVEQVIVTVNIALRRQMSQLQYYTEGNIPEAICGVPDTWNLDTVKQFQIYWDSMMEGNTAQRRHMKFVPVDASKIKELRPDPLKDEFDEWLARVICFAFSIPPTSLIKQLNRSVADNAAKTAKEEGLLPLLNYLRTFFNELIERYYGDDRLEFKWTMKDEVAPREQAEVDKIYVELGVYDEDHVRERQGLEPLTDEDRAKIAKRKAEAAALAAPQFGAGKPGATTPAKKDENASQGPVKGEKEPAEAEA